MEKFYITTAIPYVNAKPHIGHALEFVQTDVIARYHRLLGYTVLTLCGGDENALKNVQAAQKAGKPVQEFIDENNNAFYALTKSLNVCYNVWQKGSDTTRHYPASRKLWELCEASGDIYKKAYTGLYCIGCELFYEKDELNKQGECFEHPGRKLEIVSEENYFFKLSKYQDTLLKLITLDLLQIVPEFRKNEVVSFLKQPLHDISISRTNERAKNWGIPVPNDPTQRMYVWFDALNIYQSGIGFGWDEEQYQKWWPADLHVIGKGITRFHAVYWPAFLLSAQLKLPKKLFVHGYLTVEGQKMSKTIGNVVDPVALIKKYGVDAVRYYLLREIPSYGDGDFSERRFKELYNADLANELGNLVSRVAQLARQNKLDHKRIMADLVAEERQNYLIAEVEGYLDDYQFDKVLSYVWGNVKTLNQYINAERPWKKSASEALIILHNVVVGTESLRALSDIAEVLSIFLPSTAQKINTFIQTGELPKLLFPRIS